MLDTQPTTTAAAPALSRPPLAPLLGALFVAAVVAVDPAGLVPSGPARWTVMSIVMGIAVVSLLRQPLRFDRLTGGLWLGLIGWLGLASLAGADPLSAWIGTPDRRLGWIAWCTFPLMFLCGQALDTRRDRRIVFRGAAIAAVALGVWCGLERAGWSLLDESFAGHRVGGPFGQPAYVGAAAVLLVPLAAGVAFDGRESRAWRFVGVIGVVGAAGGLLLSQTRGAWLGVAVALFLVCARHGSAVRKHWREAVFALVTIAALFAVTPLGGRVVDAFDLHHGTTRGRFDDWTVGATVVVHHPLLGVGPEGYRIVFPQYVSASYVRRNGTEVIPDRAHNGVIDVATSGGVVAGLLYGALLVVLFLAAWRSLRTRDPVKLAVGCALIGYIVQQQFLFPLSEVDPLFWIVAGMLFATRSNRSVELRRAPAVVPVLVALCVALAAVTGTREIVADRLLERAARAPAASDLRDADRATRLRPDSIRVWYADARIAARGPALTDVDAAVARVEQGLRRSPRDPALRLLDADLLVERAVRSGLDDDRTRASAVVVNDLAGAPNEPELWIDRGELARLGGDESAEAAARAAAARLQPPPVSNSAPPGEKP